MDELQKLGETQNSVFFLSVDGIIYIKTVNSMPLTKEVMQENFELVRKISLDLGRPLKVFAESSKMQRLNRCAREYMRSEEAKSYDQYVVGSALLTPNQLSKMLGNFIIGLRKQARPIKVFTNEVAALDWLKAL